MKVYDRVKEILLNDEQAKNSDKVLYWHFIERSTPPWKPGLDFETWMKLPSFETVRRTRQKLQETDPEKYGATSSKVKQERKQKQETKGTFIYRELL